jgi:hypothetical protein
MDGMIMLLGERQVPAAILDVLRTLGYEDAQMCRALAERFPAPAVTDDPAAAARAALGQWFARLIGRDGLDSHEAFRRGRAAFLACDAAARWPLALLADELPADLVAGLRQSVPLAAPPDEPASMAIQPLESPAPLAAATSWLRRRPRSIKPA